MSLTSNVRGEDVDLSDLNRFPAPAVVQYRLARLTESVEWWDKRIEDWRVYTDFPGTPIPEEWVEARNRCDNEAAPWQWLTFAQDPEMSKEGRLRWLRELRDRIGYVAYFYGDIP